MTSYSAAHTTDQLAHQAATSPHNDLPHPTPEQKESGEYVKGHLTIAGLPIAIENPQGSTRSGVDADGQEWSVTMQSHYGYIEGTKGADGDEVDVIVVPSTDADFAGDVYVIAQNDQNGAFDEHKVVIGAMDADQAIEAYHANYDDDWNGFGSIQPFSMADFKEWLALLLNQMMFDAVGKDLSAITDQNVQDDPIGVLDLCLQQHDDTQQQHQALTSWNGDSVYEQFKKELASNLDDPISAAKSFFSQNLQGKYVKTTLGIVAINSKSKGKMLHRMRPAALLAIPYIPNILLDGEIGQRTLADKERKDSLVAFYEFTKVLTIEKFSIEARIKVGEYESQDGYLAYYLAGKKQSPFVSSSGAENKDATTKGQNQTGFDAIEASGDGEINIEIVSIVDTESGQQLADIDLERLFNSSVVADAGDDKGKQIRLFDGLKYDEVVPTNDVINNRIKSCLLKIEGFEESENGIKYQGHRELLFGQYGESKCQKILTCWEGQYDRVFEIGNYDQKPIDALIRDVCERLDVPSEFVDDLFAGFDEVTTKADVLPAYEDHVVEQVTKALLKIDGFDMVQDGRISCFGYYDGYICFEKDTKGLVDFVIRDDGGERLHTIERELAASMVVRSIINVLGIPICDVIETMFDGIFEQDGLTFLSQQDLEKYQQNKIRARTPRGHFTVPLIRRTLLRIEGFYDDSDGSNHSVNYSGGQYGSFIVSFERDVQNMLIIIRKMNDGGFVCGWPITDQDSTSMLVRRIIDVLGVPMTDVIETMFDSLDQSLDFTDSWFDGRIVRWSGHAQSEQAMPLPSAMEIGSFVKICLYDKGQAVEMTGQIRAIKFKAGKVQYEVALPILHTSFAAVLELNSENVAPLNGFDSINDLANVNGTDIESDPLGVLDACLLAFDRLNQITPSDHRATIQLIQKTIADLPNLSAGQQAIALSYYPELEILLTNAGYDRNSLVDLADKLFLAVPKVITPSASGRAIFGEFHEAGQFVYGLGEQASKDVAEYKANVDAALKEVTAQAVADWNDHVEKTNALLSEISKYYHSDLEEDIKIVKDLIEQHQQLRKITWAKFVEPYNDKLRARKDDLATLLSQLGQKLIDDLLQNSRIDESQALVWANQQLITPAAEKKLKSIGYTVDQVRRDAAELYQLTNGRLSHFVLEHELGTRRASTSGVLDRNSDKVILLDGDFNKTVLFHEMGHHMESDKALLQAAQAFLKKRRESDKLFRLQDLVKNSKYRRDELAYKDSFFNPYIGKYYRDGTTEVWSMGVESLANPALLVQRMNQDPEMMALIMGAIKSEQHPFAQISHAVVSEKVQNRFDQKALDEAKKSELIGKIAGYITLTQNDEHVAENTQRFAFLYPDMKYLGSYQGASLFAAKVKNPKTKRKGKGHLVCFEGFVTPLPTDDMNIAKTFIATLLFVGRGIIRSYSITLQEAERLLQILESAKK